MTTSNPIPQPPPPTSTPHFYDSYSRPQRINYTLSPPPSPFPPPNPNPTPTNSLSPPLNLSPATSDIRNAFLYLWQVAGYQTSFEDVKLSFVTVHSAGHEVPAYQPARAFKLLEKYLDGSWWGGDEDANGDRGEGGAGGGDVSEALSL